MAEFTDTVSVEWVEWAAQTACHRPFLCWRVGIPSVSSQKEEAMAISVQCKCGRSLNVPDQFAGRKIKCQACKIILDIPVPAQAAPSEETVAAARDVLKKTAHPDQAAPPEQQVATTPSKESLPAQQPVHNGQPPVQSPVSAETIEEGVIGAKGLGCSGGLFIIQILFVCFGLACLAGPRAWWWVFGGSLVALVTILAIKRLAMLLGIALAVMVGIIGGILGYHISDEGRVGAAVVIGIFSFALTLGFNLVSIDFFHKTTT